MVTNNSFSPASVNSWNLEPFYQDPKLGCGKLLFFKYNYISVKGFFLTKKLSDVNIVEIQLMVLCI